MNAIAPPYRIRLAVSADIPALRRVGVEADRRFLEVGHPELADGATIGTALAQAAIKDDGLLIAEIAGQIAGFVYLDRVAGELCIAQISVATAYGRRGVGSALLEAVIAAARQRGEASIVLNTQSDVPWNRRWYERHGFAIVPEGAWSDALRAITREQTASGLNWSTRVHMRLRLPRPSDTAAFTPSSARPSSPDRDNV